MPEYDQVHHKNIVPVPLKRNHKLKYLLLNKEWKFIMKDKEKRLTQSYSCTKNTKCDNTIDGVLSSLTLFFHRIYSIFEW